MKAFMSYSHRDEPAIDELRRHLSVLRREGSIEDWHDRQILAGTEFDHDIDQNIEVSDIIIFLVSHNFLASDYCFNIEMNRAFERHDRGEARIVPVILEPCDWQSTRLSAIKALPRDGKPISEWVNPNTAYLDIVREIRRIVSNENGLINLKAEEVKEKTGESAYRIRKDFGDIDKIRYIKSSFGEIREYFEASIAEIDLIDGIDAIFDLMDDSAFSCSVENRHALGNSAHVTIRVDDGNGRLGDFYYSWSQRGGVGSANGILHVESDGYNLLLKPVFMGFSQEEKLISPRQFSEKIWSELLEQAGIEYA